MAGTLGIVLLTWWDAKAERERIVIGYVGENGVEPETWYRADGKGGLELAPDSDYEKFTAETCAEQARALDADVMVKATAKRPVTAMEAVS
jgi:hypothetical protein